METRFSITVYDLFFCQSIPRRQQKVAWISIATILKLNNKNTDVVASVRIVFF